MIFHLNSEARKIINEPHYSAVVEVLVGLLVEVHCIRSSTYRKPVQNGVAEFNHFLL